MKKPELIYNSRGETGNIFWILGQVRRIMQKQQRINAYNELWERVQSSGSYEDALKLIGAGLGVRQAVRIQAEIDKHVLRQVNSDGRRFVRLIGKSRDRLARMALGNFLRHPLHEGETVCRRASSESCRLVLRPTFVAKAVRIVVHAFEAIVVAPP